MNLSEFWAAETSADHRRLRLCRPLGSSGLAPGRGRPAHPRPGSLEPPGREAHVSSHKLVRSGGNSSDAFIAARSGRRRSFTWQVSRAWASSHDNPVGAYESRERAVPRSIFSKPAIANKAASKRSSRSRAIMSTASSTNIPPPRKALTSTATACMRRRSSPATFWLVLMARPTVCRSGSRLR